MYLERDTAGAQLEGENAESPPVDGHSVALVHDELGSHVVWSTAESEGPSWYPLAEPEVRQLDVAHRIDEDILGFQVSIDDPVVVLLADGALLRK